MNNKEIKRCNEIVEEINDLYKQQSVLNAQIQKLKEEHISLRLLPFKIGDKVWCNVQQGKTKKETECIIETEDGVVYVRPYKKDGGLSERRFSVWDINNTFAELFRKVEES